MARPPPGPGVLVRTRSAPPTVPRGRAGRRVVRAGARGGALACTPIRPACVKRLRGSGAFCYPAGTRRRRNRHATCADDPGS
ncbi:hypothetical protein STTU_1550 [Streptomyces sp. Tu6071]|nr:hypothetical protein STTU_1550 [Streptomyces sp. Tu6071]